MDVQIIDVNVIADDHGSHRLDQKVQSDYSRADRGLPMEIRLESLSRLSYHFV